MRYVKARKDHLCTVCKETINEGEECIQSQSHYGLVYHNECHAQRFGNSLLHVPKNK